MQSWARLQGLVTLLYTFYITHLQIIHDNLSIELISLYLIAAVAPKTVQKFAENRKSTT